MNPTKRILLLSIVLAACKGGEGTLITKAAAPRPPVILISIDTLRADHLPAYGYKHGATPAIDALRKDGILFENAYSHVPLTLPSHVSLLTGQLPPDSGVRNNIGFPFDASKHPTIPSLLEQNGYETGAAVSAYVLRGNTGLAKAFDFYDDRIDVKEGEAIGRLQRPGAETEAIAEKWIGSRVQQPFFFFLHLFEPHTPYSPPEPFRSRFASPYDGEIATADSIVGKFMDFLKRDGIYDRALIILLSDHGEGLGQHGEDEHGIFLYREDIHVPLIVKLPKSHRADTSIDAPVQLIDVLPTVADLVGVKANAPGHSLLTIGGPARRIYSESLYGRIHLGWSDLRSFIDDQFHFIDAPRPELYAIKDTAEQNNVIDENRRAFASMRDALAPFRRGMPAADAIDPEEAKKLAALGYLRSSAAQPAGPLPDPKDHIGELKTLHEAASLEATGDIAGAISRYRRLVAENPRLADAWSQLGRLLQQSGNLDEAIATYKRGIEVSPSLAGAFSLSLGELFLANNQPDEAATHAQLGLSTNPGSAHIILGRAALAKGDVETATREAQAAMSVHSYRAPAQVLMAQVLVKQKRLDDALNLVNQVDEPVPLLEFVRGDILARRNQFDAAIQAFNEEIRRYPRDRDAYASLAVVYLVTGRRSRANQTMERLVRANPSPSSYALAAQTFEQLGDQADAVAWRRRGQHSTSSIDRLQIQGSSAVGP